MSITTPFPQQLATEFFSTYYSIGLKPVQVASTDRQPENHYALQIEYGNTIYADTKNADFLINEETLKDAVILFLVEDSARGSDFDYQVTDDLINAVFAMVKAKMHLDIATGHIELLLDPEALKNLLDANEIGQLHGFVASTVEIFAEKEEADKDPVENDK